MAKFILEVNNAYIREKADGGLSANVLEGKTGNEALLDLLEIISFKKIKEDIDKGQTEFHLTAADMNDEKGLEMFYRVASRIGILCLIRQKSESDENNKTKE